MKAYLRLALDLGPLLVFFLCYRTFTALALTPYGPRSAIIVATGALIAATLVSLALTYLLEKKISPMPLVSGIAVTVFGGMTIWLNDEMFIKMKPTFVNLLFAAILLAGAWFKRPMLKYVLQSALTMADEGWHKLSLRWGFFFMLLAGLNEFIWRHFPLDFWVSFKVFGMFSLTMLFMLCQIPLIKKYAVE